MIDISVVIPVYNEEGVIGRCLESVGGESLRAKEIIIVDDGSTDKTWEIVSGIKDIKNIKVIKIKQNHRGAGAARNLGAKQAAGEILVFVDADMRFSRTFLEELTAPIREGKSRGTFSKSEFIGNWDNLWARFWNYQKGIYEPIAVPKDFPNTSPVFRAIRRSEFQKVGGFDESRGYNDDWSLSEKLGYQSTEAKARFFHFNPENLAEVFIQARWVGKRRYKLGMLGALVREFPLWSPLVGVIKIIRERRKIAEPVSSLLTLYPVFLLVTSLASTIGMLEFILSKKVCK